MILIDDLGINIGVRYMGEDVAKCKEFISYMRPLPSVRIHRPSAR